MQCASYKEKFHAFQFNVAIPSMMIRLCYLMLFAICISTRYSYAQKQPVPPPSAPKMEVENYLNKFHPLNRVVRQMTEMPFPPAPPPFPRMPQWFNSGRRRRREAKGVGGYMPTRKG